MEHDGKMERCVLRKKYARCGFGVVSAWFPLSANVAWHMKIKLIDDHILNNTQKKQFPHFHGFWYINSLTFRCRLLWQISRWTSASCWIELFTPYTCFTPFWQNIWWYCCRHDVLNPNVIPGVKWNTVRWGKMALWGQNETLEYGASTAEKNCVTEPLNVVEYNYLRFFIYFFKPFVLRPGQYI